jgi:hypothetical protein
MISPSLPLRPTLPSLPGLAWLPLLPALLSPASCYSPAVAHPTLGTGWGE